MCLLDFECMHSFFKLTSTDRMNIILDCFFEHFGKLDRDTLHARYKRREMVEYFNTMIEGCCRGEQRNDNSYLSVIEICIGEESSPEKTVREAILGILKYHQRMRNQNGNVCMMGKYHNILYVAVKLCYSWQLNDPEIVSTLLKDIYNCEMTFERILIGAIFGTTAPHYIAGWKSDFNDQEENLRAVVYFLEQARASQLLLHYGYESRRFIDIPVESCGKETALKICVQLGLPDKLHILLRFGALIFLKDDRNNILEYLLNRLNEFNHSYPYNIVACLQLLLRVLPNLNLMECDDQSLSGGKSNIIREKYADLIEDGLIPPTRCGIEPPELKHLSRCCVRQQLWLLHQLPNGIHLLPLPNSLKRYLDLLTD